MNRHENLLLLYCFFSLNLTWSLRFSKWNLKTLPIKILIHYSTRDNFYPFSPDYPRDDDDYGSDESNEDDDNLVPILHRKRNVQKTERGYFLDDSGGVGSKAYAQISPLLENIVTKMAVNTTAFYADMIGDQATMRWLRGVKNFDSDGFTTIPWTEYVDELMHLNPFDVRVRMPATKQALYQLIGGNEKLLHQLQGMKDTNRIRIESTQRIEPRKVLSQILKDRLSICKEIIFDLQSVWDENEEAMRYANTWKEQGREAADASRRLCREDTSEGSSSPHRGENFVELTILVINIAIDLVSEDLVSLGTPNALMTAEFLSDFAEVNLDSLFNANRHLYNM
jgi:hypothetical protein